MDGGYGSSSGDVSSMPATDQMRHRAGRDEPYLIGVMLNHAPVAPSRVRVQRGNGTEPPVIFVQFPDGDAEDDAGAGAADDDAHGGFGFGAVPVPASGVAIACLPETTVGEPRECGQCAVCLEEFEAGDAMRTMPCKHGFHEHCIFGWLCVSRLCPLCRFALPPEE